MCSLQVQKEESVMSLGIAIVNENGIALGADSLVSQVELFSQKEAVFFSHKIKEILFNILKGEDVDKEKLATLLKVDPKDFLMKRVVKNFRSSKIDPIYRYNDKHYGAMIGVGDAFISRIAGHVFNDMIDNFQDIISFKEYVERSLSAIASFLINSDDDMYHNASLLYLGYCLVENEYKALNITFHFDPEEDDNEKVKIDINDVSDMKFIPIGDKQIVDRIILGKDNNLSRFIIGNGDDLLDIIKSPLGLIVQSLLTDCFGEDVFEKTVLKNAKERAKDFWLSGNEDFWKVINESGLYDSKKDELEINGLLVIVIIRIHELISKSLGMNRDIDHLSETTLLENLNVVEWLIDSTSKFHAHIKDEIPTVGGDIYLATITRTEGFIFKSPR